LREHRNKNDCDAGFGAIQEEWLYQWLCFIDHLAEGKSAEEYFKELLP
jgi:hypothetical protein